MTPANGADNEGEEGETSEHRGPQVVVVEAEAVGHTEAAEAVGRGEDRE
eukprot:CAMPEP_0173226682 /NCGR_PEP_ID=MMETSP1142-20121109/5563_1 /TAXON_ID=483371 /ORGANISM="non described non described, Strain CCMP2298" /LENGTH=48 /DNA_ID= /DNA_START= /DNA_END= /DNA_ORIENTATION=